MRPAGLQEGDVTEESCLVRCSRDDDRKAEKERKDEQRLKKEGVSNWH